MTMAEQLLNCVLQATSYPGMPQPPTVSLVTSQQQPVSLATNHQQAVSIATNHQQPVSLATNHQQAVSLATKHQQVVSLTTSQQQSVAMTSQAQRPVASDNKTAPGREYGNASLLHLAKVISCYTGLGKAKVTSAPVTGCF